MKRSLRYAEYVLLVIGTVLLGWCVVSVGREQVAQAYENWRLNRELAHKPAAAKPAAAPVPRLHPGDVFGRLEVPRLGLSVMVWEGDDPWVLSKGAGHLPETARPGQPGNVAIAAHRDTLFRPLKDIRKGDLVTLTTPAAAYTYHVESTEIVPPTFTQVLDPPGYQALTLVTCYPFYYIGKAPDRFIVRAREVNPQSASTPSLPAHLPEAAKPAVHARRQRRAAPKAAVPKVAAAAPPPAIEPAAAGDDHADAGDSEEPALPRKRGFFHRIFHGITRR